MQTIAKMAPANTSAFNKDEKVFCFHHELLYEARIVDVRRVDEKDKNSPWEYLVHYKGWKNTWDDWVPQDRLRKLTDEYRELAANLKKDLIAQDSRRQPAQTKSTKKGGKDERGSEGRDSAAPSSKRRKEKDNEIETEDHFMGKPMINMYIPDTIKGYLVDDWEYVTKNYQLVPLPAKYPVNWIMDEYFDQEKVNRRLGSPEAQFLEEVRIGIKEWFKRALGKTLLYRFEREQYSDVSAWWEDVTDPNDKWYGRGVGDCYGVEHLCRLLVKIPEYISHTNMDAQSINTMRKELDQFMSWLARNAPEFMCKEYTQATQEYIERATGSSGR